MNKLTPLNEALAERKFEKGLSSYTQSNCQVTLTEKGYRIYRPPNLTVANNGNTMWGGLVLRPWTNDSNFLIKGHTYIMMFHVKGQSSNNATDIYWTNNCGWGGHGLDPAPTNVYIDNIGENFNGEKEVVYKFTVSDDIMKTCTSSYSSFVEGTQYNSYRDFKFGFGYTSTGTLGTDLYVTNLRLYDITNSNNVIDVTKAGIVTGCEFVESTTPLNGKANFFSSGEILTQNFIEI